MLIDSCANSMLNAISFDTISLHFAFSKQGENEIHGGSPAYERKPISMANAASKIRNATSAPVFDVPAGTVAWVGVWSDNGAVFRGMFANGGTEMEFIIGSGDMIVAAEEFTEGEAVVFIGGDTPGDMAEGEVCYVANVNPDDHTEFQVANKNGHVFSFNKYDPACKLSRIILEEFKSQGTFTVSGLSIGIM